MATPAAVEPRTACPVCGGPVHPIAGRCKHCKADLARMRTGAAAAASPATSRPELAALGSLAARSAPTADGAGATRPAGAGATAPRLATSAAAVDPAPRSSWSSRWPLLVAFVAVVAIVASVALLLFGGGGKKDRGVRRFDGPAPELMPTDPLAPPPAPPAPQPNGTAPHAGIVPDVQPDPAPAPNAPAPPPAPPAPAARGPRTAGDFVSSAIDVTCRRLSACSADDQIVSLCGMARMSLPQIQQSLDDLCADYDRAAAGECLDALSRFPCPDGALDPLAMGDSLMALNGCQRVCPSAISGLGGVTGGSLGMTP